jgi:vanillate O-demethylase monooxygenase subunit
MDTSDVVDEVGNQLDVAGEARLYRALRHFWQPVMYAADLGERPEKVVLLGEQLVVARLGSEVRCFADLCVHRGTALSLGRVEGDQLRCAYHGWTYGPDGMCTSIPSCHGVHIPRRAQLTAYSATEAAGLVWVCLGGEPRLPVPEFPQLDDPRFRVITVEPYEWDTSAARRLENYVDFGHFAWVHDGVLGSRDHPEVPDHEVQRVGGELRFGYTDFAEPAATTKNEGTGTHATELIPTQISYRLFMPSSVLLDQELPGGYHYLLFFTVCPVGPRRVRAFTMMGRDYQLDDVEAGDQTMRDFNDLVIAQDRPVVESQRPENLPFDLSAELHIRGADKVSLEYRRWLIELASELP